MSGYTVDSGLKVPIKIKTISQALKFSKESLKVNFEFWVIIFERVL